jgi:hypothetical protein
MQKKYKSLVKELSFVNSEYEYVMEVVKDAHKDFETYYRRYCAENKVPIEDINEKNKSKLQKVFPKKKPTVDESGIVKINKKPKTEKADKTLQKMYRAVAVKIHPDKFSSFEETPEIIEKTEMFKEASTAYNDGNWAIFLDICEKLDILPNRYIKVMEVIREEISELKKKIAHEKATFSWKLYECDDEEKCKKKIVGDFLFQLFKYKVGD